MRLSLLAVVILLVACDSPSPGMRGGGHFRTEFEGVKVTIWQKQHKVEIIRHSFAYGQESGQIICTMARAAAAKTGCRLRPETIEGDAGVLRARLQCDAAPQPATICPGSRKSDAASD